MARADDTNDAALRRQLRTIATQLRRARTGTLQPSIAKFGLTPELAQSDRDLRLLEEEISALLARLDGQAEQ